MQAIRTKKSALLLTLAMTVVVTVLRAVLIPPTQSVKTGLFSLSYVVIGAMVLTMAAALFLLFGDEKAKETLPAVRGKWLLPLAITVMAVGVCVLLSTVFDVYNWGAFGVTPPPTKIVTGAIDRVTLFLTMVFGVLTGIYLLRLGFSFIEREGEQRGLLPYFALTPTLWMWMRLARYEVSYASAVEIYESFYDFAMLLFSMLFLFTWARHAAAVGTYRPRRLLFYALCTAMLSLSGSVARVIFFLLGEGDAYSAGQLAGVPDFAVGCLAAVMSLYWALTPTEETTAAEEPSAENAEETEETPSKPTQED